MSQNDEPSDEDLLALSRAGNEGAFTALYRRRQGALFRFAVRMSGSSTVAEDVVQEAFMVLVHSPQRYDPALGSLAGFLFGIARNRVRRHLEKRRRDVPLAEADEARPDAGGRGRPDAELVQRESVAALREAVLTLPDVFREVVVLVELEELSYAETAGALGCSLGTVRSRLHRARRMLASRLDGRSPAPARARGGAEGRYA
jgi:RNA polymerase sigma-70 factor (ECF subfamily)